NTGYCTTTNNNINDKNGYIRTILTAYYPDILTVCEIGRGSNLPNDFLNNVLNINGLNYWMTSAGSNTGNSSSLINCIFYNSTKLTLTGHHTAQTYTRDVDVYDFTFKNDDSGKIQLTCVIAHLKAGTGSDNESKRKMMAENTMRYLEANYRERNVLIMGDFNLYTSSEPAYQALTNQSTYPNSFFIDPLYPYGVGAWNSNYNYKDYHTQSTHKDNDSNCHSSGGMDDRFDFILMSENIYGGRDGIRYIGGSYNALGNDGNRYNKSINYPVNQAVSQAVADALYNNSDHIPVTMELVAYLNEDVNEMNTNELSFDIFPNPASKEINIRFYQENLNRANILLINTLGQTVYSKDVFVNDCLSEHVINVENLPKGFYFLKITNADGLTNTSKIVVE
ncbi:MAG: T9SS type A sorting domain-containing protein, partial [Bacteroidales bacterium]|nr:T9SS type A sorting domain-containing protein [Bacteroidales bacterium]